MQIKLSKRGSTLIVGLVGELDHHSAEYAREKIDAELIRSTTRNVVFDFSKVSFMDSSGIGVIMGRYKNVSKLEGRVAISDAMPQVKKILEMSGILRFIPYYRSTVEATAAIAE